MSSGAATPSDPMADELDREQAQIMRAVRRASDEWANAMRAHVLAPPDAGFASRLRALAEAAESTRTPPACSGARCPEPRARSHRTS
jgi:hypothetical protein